jgi:hypothetical protein
MTGATEAVKSQLPTDLIMPSKSLLGAMIA